MSELHAIARLKIHHGKLEEFKRLAVKCMESVRTRDSGTLQYDWFFSDDHSECVVRERYRDSAARGVRRADLLSVPVDLMRRRNLGVSQVSIRPAIAPDHAAVLALADRLPAFGPTTRPASEIADRERAVLATALSQPVGGSAILVADQPSRGVVGVSLLESRRDYFTNEAHGHVAILAVAREAEGQGIGRALLQAGEDWARANRYSKLTLAVFRSEERRVGKECRVRGSPEQ